jgi:hypothetical protein
MAEAIKQLEIALLCIQNLKKTRDCPIDMLCFTAPNKSRQRHYVDTFISQSTCVKFDWRCRPHSLPMQTQNISSSTHHIKYLDACMEY